jgi:hypothetical protein
LRLSRQWLWWNQSSGMWRYVDIVLPDVSEERIDSIFRAEDNKKSASEQAWAGATDWVQSSKISCIRACLLWLPCRKQKHFSIWMFLLYMSLCSINRHPAVCLQQSWKAHPDSINFQVNQNKVYQIWNLTLKINWSCPSWCHKWWQWWRWQGYSRHHLGEYAKGKFHRQCWTSSCCKTCYSYA